MNAFGIVLIHGYSGQPEELLPIGRRLGEQHGKDAVRIVNLPGHADGNLPAFDAKHFGQIIDEAVHLFRREDRHIILLGHSTGGILAMDHLQRTKTIPTLLILAGAPAIIRGRDLKRWEQHRRGRYEISLSDVARMVSFINRVVAIPMSSHFPVLILQGDADPLVPPSHVKMWSQGRFSGSARSIIIPKAGHNLFCGPGSKSALDSVCRSVVDACAQPSMAEQVAADALKAMDKDVEGFMVARPLSTRHLVSSPGALRALKKPVRFDSIVNTDPIQVNIEITTRCNLSCAHCARSHRKRSDKDMGQEAFQYLLDLLPNTFKVVMVGLGEPTLHPKLVDFVALAAQRGHWVGLVTNAMSLKRDLSRRLITAGLRGLTFSLDSVDADLISQVRRGSDLDQIIGNIRDFIELADGKIPTAVFTAVSLHTVQLLPTLAAAVADLGVKAWMLSDLNFQWNLSKTIWQNLNLEHQIAIGQAIKFAFSNSLPVLSVRGVEELGLSRRFGEFLLTAPAALGQRSISHKWCLSPWQTLPVDVDGYATVCDCLPDVPLGNLFEQSFDDIWNGAIIQKHRRLMRSETPSTDCLVCPRF